MRSALPKVLHPLAHLSLLEHVINAAEALGADDIHVVYGHGGDVVPETLSHKKIDWILQSEQLGTGHAVAKATPSVKKGNKVLVLYGDVPLTSYQTLRRLVDLAEDNTLSLLTVNLEDPSGYGRIVRDGGGNVSRIVEHKDASAEEQKINEVNTGILCTQAAQLNGWLERLSNDNAQGEYYLTDIIEMAVNGSVPVVTSHPADEFEVLGVNNKIQLAELERYYQLQQATRLMEAGVTLRDPHRLDVRGDIECGQDVTIDVNVTFEGGVKIGNNVAIAPNCHIKNADIGDGVTILANTVIEDAVIGARSSVGPFARLRPQTRLAEEARIGNFVETKKADIGRGSKINHLSYVGDTCVGANVNIGAGVITCNYDGANKYLTEVGDDVFIGSDTQLIAPVTIGSGATIGAGSTITKDVAPDVLALSRSKQMERSGWKRPTKQKKTN